MGVLESLTSKQRAFLKCFEACSSILQASRWAKINRQTHYDWLEQPIYAAAFERSQKVAARTLEDEAVRRAHEGVRKTIRYKGKVVGYEQEYSDSLMLALLKANSPEKFRDRWSGELTGKDGNPLFGYEAVRKFMQDDSSPDE